MKKIIAKLFGITSTDIENPATEHVAEERADPTPVSQSPTPGEIEVHGKIRENGQIELKIDWNDEFIKELKANGYNGANEEVIIQQYLATLHRRLLEEEKGGEFN